MKLLTILAAIPIFAADLSGIIQAAGRPVPLSGVRVTVAGKSTLTDASGRYTLSGLPTGAPLRALAEAPGFTPAEKDVQLPATLDFSLSLANRKESIIVESGLLSVRSDAPEQSQTISQTQMEQLPANGRRLMRFALLDPHVRPAIGLGAFLATNFVVARFF